MDVRYVDERVHKNDVGVKNFYNNSAEIPYEDFGCKYCGSLTPEEALRLIKHPLTSIVLADQKYGFPHKFYIDSMEGIKKFYSKHLYDADEETFTLLRGVLEKKGKVYFEMNADNLQYSIL